MKRTIKTIAVIFFLAMLPVLSNAQPPSPNSGGTGGANAPGGSNTPTGGGAPIDGGLSILMLLGAAYGSKKVYKLRQ